MRNPDDFFLAPTHPYNLELARLGQKPTHDNNTQVTTGNENPIDSNMGLVVLATKATALERDTDVELTTSIH